MNKRAVIVALTGLNLLLLGGLILSVYELPKAQAQAVGQGHKYLMVAGETEEGIDALYILDRDRQVLDVIIVNQQGNRPLIAGVREGPDLRTDLRPQQENLPRRGGGRRR